VRFTALLISGLEFESPGSPNLVVINIAGSYRVLPAFVSESEGKICGSAPRPSGVSQWSW
jgi:hypothetical protein